MKRYSILVREHGAEYELCQCDSNPKAVATGARNKKVTSVDPVTSKRSSMPKYVSVRIRENQQ